MRVLFCHSSKFKEHGGNLYSTTFTRELWETRYLKIFSEMTVIGRDGGKVSQKELAELTMANSENVSFRLLSFQNIYLSHLLHRGRLKQFFRTAINDCDCVIARMPSILSCYAVDEAIKQNKPFLVEVVGCAWSSLWYHSLMGKLLALPAYIAMKRAVKVAPYAIYVTKDYLQRRYPCNGETEYASDVILPELDYSVFENRASTILSRHGKLTLGTIGNVNLRYKGQHYVIKALGLLKQKGLMNFEYQLVGNGDNKYLIRAAKKAGIEDRVVFLGNIPHNKINNWLDKLDIYIQPSLTEGLPRALIEAMSRGLMCLGSAVGGIPELLPKNRLFATNQMHRCIADILSSVSRDDLLFEARNNFNKAIEYQAEYLDTRRYAILSKLMLSSMNQSKSGLQV